MKVLVKGTRVRKRDTIITKVTISWKRETTVVWAKEWRIAKRVGNLLGFVCPEMIVTGVVGRFLEIAALQFVVNVSFFNKKAKDSSNL